MVVSALEHSFDRGFRHRIELVCDPINLVHCSRSAGGDGLVDSVFGVGPKGLPRVTNRVA